MRIVLAGGSGFIGRGLTGRFLREGHEVVLLARLPRQGLQAGVRAVRWDGMSRGEWWSAIDGAGAVVNLSGEPLAGGRWTARRKQALRDSRVLSTRAIVDAIGAARVRPRVLVNSSAVGYYGDVPEADAAESHPPGRGFLPELAVEWEREAARSEEFGVRAVMLRCGIVLDAGGGALPPMALAFKLFVGGRVGSGRQWMPWVHREDVASVVMAALSRPAIAGPVNVAAPGIVRMAEFCRELARALGRPSWLPAPPLLLRLMLGEMSIILLTGQRAVPEKLSALGFTFDYPDLRMALKSILTRTTHHP